MNNLLEKNAKVMHDRDLECLHVHLSGFIPYQDLVRALEYEFKMIRHYRLKECIVDLREIQVYPSGGKEYVSKVWFPQIEKDGVKYVAFIVPASVFGEISMQKAHEKVGEHKALQTRYFKDEPSAREWIGQVKSLLVY